MGSGIGSPAAMASASRRSRSCRSRSLVHWFGCFGLGPGSRPLASWSLLLVHWFACRGLPVGAGWLTGAGAGLERVEAAETVAGVEEVVVGAGVVGGGFLRLSGHEAAGGEGATRGAGGIEAATARRVP